MTDYAGCCHGFREPRGAVAGAAPRCGRSRARGSACGAGARPAADGEQRGADRPQPHRHVVHGAHFHQGARGGRRGAVAGDRGGAGAGRRGHRGADAGGAEFRCAPLPARGPGGVDRVVGDGLRGAAVRAGGRRAPPDSRAVRVRSAGRAARLRVLVSACRRRLRRSGGVGHVRILQRHRAAARHAADHRRDHGHECAPEPAVHLPPRLGHRRFRLGHERRAADRPAVRGGDFSARALPPPLRLAPDVAAARRHAAAAAAPRGSDGAVTGRGPAGVRHLSDDADAARHGGRRRHADGGDSDLTRLHARVRHRFGGHDAGRAIHRRGGARLGAAGGQTA